MSKAASKAAELVERKTFFREIAELQIKLDEMWENYQNWPGFEVYKPLTDSFAAFGAFSFSFSTTSGFSAAS